MKKIFCFFAIGLFVAVTLFSCDDFLDINNNPNNPSSVDVTIDARLPWFQHYFLSSYVCTGMRVACIMQHRSFVNRTGNEGLAQGWRGGTGFSTTSYQGFFVGGACNYNDLMVAAEKEGAYHYMGAAMAIRAAGFMMMGDLYGEMPYSEALSEAITPKYDDGKEIFYGCLDELDQAIELLKKTQEPGATPLSKGDSWNEGDVDKWIRLCYGLKARSLNNLTKKPDYNPDDVLAALANAPTSNANATVVKHYDIQESSLSDFLWGDPMQTSYAFNWMSMNANSRLSKWYIDLLTDFDGKGIEDPRANSFIPWAQVGGATKQWMRSEGVDLQSDIRIDGGPFPTTYDVDTKKWYCNTTNANRLGDTVYVSFRTGAIGYFGTSDDQYRATDQTILASGTVFNLPASPTMFLTYPEMAFIEAEAQFRKGNTAAAFEAYKKGISSNIELINNYLTAGSTNPSKAKMEQTDIDNFLNNAIGTATDLTLAKIMTQKFLALSWNYQNWNDMRRLDYGLDNGVAPGAYYDWAIPYEYFQDANAQMTIPLGKQYRRWSHCSHERNYNSANLRDSHPKAYADDIYCYPVWWDYPNDNYKN